MKWNELRRIAEKKVGTYGEREEIMTSIDIRGKEKFWK
jgi:hypothetical protein